MVGLLNAAWPVEARELLEFPGVKLNPSSAEVGFEIVCGACQGVDGACQGVDGACQGVDDFVVMESLGKELGFEVLVG